MVLSGMLIGFICVFALLMAALLLAFLDRREKSKGNVQKSRLLSRAALTLFLGAFVGGVVMTLIAGVQPRRADDIATARGMAGARSPPMQGRGMIRVAPEPIDEKELQRLQEKVAQDPRDVASRERLGHLYLKLKDFENVFRMAHEVLQISPKSVESRAHMGMVLFSMQQIDSALRQLEIALEIDSKNLEALLYKGMVQFMALNDAVGAKASWDKYLQISNKDDPGRSRVRMFLNMLGAPRESATSTVP